MAMVDPEGDYLVRNPEVEAKLKEYGRKFQSELPEGYGFMLMIFKYGEGGDLFYMSSAERDDVLNTMQEFINREREKSHG